jgi:hypothetical protein
MKPPYIAGALKGWTAKLTVMFITKTVVDHRVQEVKTSAVVDINYQPMPPAQVARKPEEQRTWIWWTLIIKGQAPLLKTDDTVSVNGLNFRIQNARDWRTSGASIYEAIQDFQRPAS